MKIFRLIVGAMMFVGLVGGVWAEEFVGEMIGAVKLEGEYLDGDILKIDVLVEDLQIPIIGSAFHLDFEVEKLAFLKYVPGEFLERGGDPFYLVKEEDGKIVFGETLRWNDNFPMGNGEMVSFFFQILQDEELGFVFENAVLSSLDEVRQDLDNIEWRNLLLTRDGAKEMIFDGNTGVEVNVAGASYDGFANLKVAFLMFFLVAALWTFRLVKKGEKWQVRSLKK